MKKLIFSISIGLAVLFYLSTRQPLNPNFRVHENSMLMFAIPGVLSLWTWVILEIIDANTKMNRQQRYHNRHGNWQPSVDDNSTNSLLTYTVGQLTRDTFRIIWDVIVVLASLCISVFRTLWAIFVFLVGD